MDADRFNRILNNNKNNLAFVVGNGVNRYGYGTSKDIGWETLLLKIWNELSGRTRSEIPVEGISFTEFYDLLSLVERNEIEDIRDRVIRFFKDFKPAPYHFELQEVFQKWDVPVLTTNFDESLSASLAKKWINDKLMSLQYPWNAYWSDKKLLSPLDGFAVWHVNGMVSYKNSITLGLTEYINQSSYARGYLHSLPEKDDFNLKDMPHWKGEGTWLHIIFNCSLCIFGLGLDVNETFLRWLLIERKKYFNMFRDRVKNGWYVCIRGSISDGNKFFLDTLGIEIIELDSYDEVYRKMLGLPI